MAAAGFTRVVGTMPFDAFFRHVTDTELEYYNSGNEADSQAFMDVLEYFYLATGLEPIQQRFLRDLDDYAITIADAPYSLRDMMRDWCADSALINNNAQKLAFFNAVIANGLPALTKPLTVYRVFTNGIWVDGARVDLIPASEWNMTGARSFTASQSFSQYFAATAGGVNPETRFVRCDLLTGISVLPVQRYTDFGGRHVKTELEFVLLQPDAQNRHQQSRIHVLTSTLVVEGREETPVTNVVYNKEPFRVPEFPTWPPRRGLTNPLISYYFVVSKPDTNIEYYPFDEGDPSHIRSLPRGGAKPRPVLLTNYSNRDAKLVGVGNVEELIEAYIKSQEAPPTESRPKAHTESRPKAHLTRVRRTVAAYGGRKRSRGKRRSRK